MDIMSLISSAVAFGIIVWGIVFQGGNPMDFYNPAALAVTAGGTLAALVMTFPLGVFFSMPKMLVKIFTPYRFSPDYYVKQLVEISVEVKRTSVIAIEDRIPSYKDAFLKKGLTLVADLIESKDIREILETEILSATERHKTGIRFFEKGAVYAPAFGMIGTFAGLVNMIAQIGKENVDLMGIMSSSLITALYGLILANLFFIPAGNRLRQKSIDEFICKQIIIEGVVAITEGENPSKVQERLDAFIPPKIRSGQVRII